MKLTKINKLDFTGQDIFAGIDIHKKNWSVCLLTEESEHKVFTMDPKPDILINYLKKISRTLISTAHTKRVTADSGRMKN